MTSEKQHNEQEKALEGYILAIAKEDAAAFEALYLQTKTAVYAYALSILKNTHDAEDVLHDCYVHIHHGAGSYKPQGHPMAWIMTIAKNLCMRKFGERKGLSDLPEEDRTGCIEGSESVTPEDRMVLEQVMRLLSDEERQILVLYLLSGFKHREIARIMDLPLATVLSKYHRALKKMKKHL